MLTGLCRAAVAPTQSPEDAEGPSPRSTPPSPQGSEEEAPFPVGSLFPVSPTDPRIQRWPLLFSRFLRPVLLLCSLAATVLFGNHV